MIAVVQRVVEAEVTVGEARVGRIGRGMVVLVAVQRGDGPAAVGWMAQKLAGLRIFPSEEGQHPFHRDVREIGGGMLLVSNFTVAADCRKGRRPALEPAAGPQEAQPLFDSLVAAVRQEGVHVETGSFGAAMRVRIENDGPVTFLVETPRRAEGG